MGKQTKEYKTITAKHDHSYPIDQCLNEAAKEGYVVVGMVPQLGLNPPRIIMERDYEPKAAS